MLTHTPARRLAFLLVPLLALGSAAAAPPQTPAATPAAPSAAGKPASQPAAAKFKPEELEQIAAGVALYPDAVLAQVLMAATYPLEVVQAERWVNEHKDLKGDALTRELEKQSWDPSVKSLVNFPQVLTSMSKQLDLTIKLGDAFIADQAAVMNAVQRLRAKAQAAGNLKDTPEQKVIVEKTQAPPQVVVVQGEPAPPPQVIKIESPSPQVVYVPTYNPTVVYGTWPYPSYPPPAPYYPPGYVATAAVSFGVGMAVGAAWGYAWGGCNWHGGDVDIDVDRNTNINNNINRENYKQNINNRQTSANRTDVRGAQGGNRTANSFQHDPAHRKGVSYRDQATANQFSSPQSRQASQARESYRGRAETGRQDIARGGAGASPSAYSGGRGGAGGAGGAGGGQLSSYGNRSSGAGSGAAGAGGGRTAGAGAGSSAGGAGGARSAGYSSGAGGSRSPSASPSATSSSRGGAFEGVNSGGSQARASSSRGSASRSSPPARSSSYSGGGGSRSGGGGARGGGGGRGGGGRR